MINDHLGGMIIIMDLDYHYCGRKHGHHGMEMVKVIMSGVKVYMATTVKNMMALPNNLDLHHDVTKHLATLRPILPSRTLPSTTHTFAI